MYAITLAAPRPLRVHTALRVRARDMCIGTCAPYTEETAVSARESKFIEPRRSSIRSSLLCQNNHLSSLPFREIKLKITIKRANVV